MKLNEIIELNGEEYTVELNRESIVRIEQYINMGEISAIMSKQVVEDKSNSEIPDDEDPFSTVFEDEEIEKLAQEKENAIIKVYTRAFWIWLYPIEKLSLKEVAELLKPYLQDEKKAEYIAEKYKYFSEKSIEIRENYINEQKNLKAQAK